MTVDRKALCWGILIVLHLEEGRALSAGRIRHLIKKTHKKLFNKVKVQSINAILDQMQTDRMVKVSTRYRIYTYKLTPFAEEMLNERFEGVVEGK